MRQHKRWRYAHMVVRPVWAISRERGEAERKYWHSLIESLEAFAQIIDQEKA